MSNKLKMSAFLLVGLMAWSVVIFIGWWHLDKHKDLIPGPRSANHSAHFSRVDKGFFTYTTYDVYRCDHIKHIPCDTHNQYEEIVTRNLFGNVMQRIRYSDIGGCPGILRTNKFWVPTCKDGNPWVVSADSGRIFDAFPSGIYDYDFEKALKIRNRWFNMFEEKIKAGLEKIHK